MKINKYIAYLLIALPALLLQSCLKDDDDVFDKPASTRMQEYLASTRSTLRSSEYGWVFNMYPGKNQEYGGCAITCKFDSLTVEAQSELAAMFGAPISTTVESYYKMTTDDGPVLTFDTYNAFLHVFSTPSSGAYEGMNGDFEFVIDSIGTDSIKVHSKQTGNVQYLVRLKESADDYLAKLSDIQESFLCGGIDGTVGGKHLYGEIDMNNLQLTYYDYDDMTNTIKQVAFVFTDKGISFYEPISFGGETIRELAYDAATNSFSYISAAGEKSVVNGFLPEGYVKFEDFAGDYFFKFNIGMTDKSDSVSVTLVPGEDGKSYLMKGINPNYDLKLVYDKAIGSLSLNTQPIFQTNGYIVWWQAEKSGRLAPAYTQYGLNTMLTKGGEKPVYSLQSDNSTGFCFWITDANGNSIDQYTDGDLAIGSRYLFVENIYLIKK